jgi:hypothetical protein
VNRKAKLYKKIKKNLETLPDKYKFFIKRISLEGEKWLNLDRRAGDKHDR